MDGQICTIVDNYKHVYYTLQPISQVGSGREWGTCQGRPVSHQLVGQFPLQLQMSAGDQPSQPAATHNGEGGRRGERRDVMPLLMMR